MKHVITTYKGKGSSYHFINMKRQPNIFSYRGPMQDYLVALHSCFGLELELRYINQLVQNRQYLQQIVTGILPWVIVL